MVTPGDGGDVLKIERGVASFCFVLLGCFLVCLIFREGGRARG